MAASRNVLLEDDEEKGRGQRSRGPDSLARQWLVELGFAKETAATLDFRTNSLCWVNDVGCCCTSGKQQ